MCFLRNGCHIREQYRILGKNRVDNFLLIFTEPIDRKVFEIFFVYPDCEHNPREFAHFVESRLPIVTIHFNQMVTHSCVRL